MPLAVIVYSLLKKAKYHIPTFLSRRKAWWKANGKSGKWQLDIQSRYLYSLHSRKGSIFAGNFWKVAWFYSDLKKYRHMGTGYLLIMLRTGGCVRDVFWAVLAMNMTEISLPYLDSRDDDHTWQPQDCGFPGRPWGRCRVKMKCCLGNRLCRSWALCKRKRSDRKQEREWFPEGASSAWSISTSWPWVCRWVKWSKSQL